MSTEALLRQSQEKLCKWRAVYAGWRLEVMLQECTELDRLQELKFPGFSTSLSGVHMDVQRAAPTMREKGFPA